MSDYPLAHKIKRSFEWIPPDKDSTAFRKRQMDRIAKALEDERARMESAPAAEVIAWKRKAAP